MYSFYSFSFLIASFFFFLSKKDIAPPSPPFGGGPDQCHSHSPIITRLDTAYRFSWFSVTTTLCNTCHTFVYVSPQISSPNSFHNTPSSRSQTSSKLSGPGKSLYNEIIRYGRKSFIVGTSMVKGPKVKDMNRNLKNTSVTVRYFLWATVKQLHHYVISTLTDDTPHTIIIQGGRNNVSNKNSNPKDIAKAIGSLGNLCRSHGVNQVLISSVKNVEKTFIWIIKLRELIFYLSWFAKKTVSFLLITITLLVKIYGRMVPTFLIEGNDIS